MTNLYEQDEFVSGALDPMLLDVANRVIRMGAPAGDEGRVLSAWLVVSLSPAKKTASHAQRRYRSLATWSHQVRAELGDPISRISQLIDVWQNHAELTPTRRVLAYLSQLHMKRREAARRRLGSTEIQLTSPGAFGGSVRPSMLKAMIGRTPLDLASIYLREGNLRGAVRALGKLPNKGETDERVLQALIQASGKDDESRQALYELSETFRPTRADVALGICRKAQRSFPGGLRFPVCLARIASQQGRSLDATAWYIYASKIAPEERALYDEALSTMRQLLENNMLETNLRDARVLSQRTATILRERERRWPHEKPPITRDQIAMMLGMLEMNAGNIKKAQTYFESSIRIRPSADTLLQLGTLALRSEQYDRAITSLRRAVQMSKKNAPHRIDKRAEAWEHLGDALRQRKRHGDAQKAYRQALKLWGELSEGMRGSGMAAILLRQGVLKDRLGRHEESVDTFHRAMSIAPNWRDGYASILAYLVANRPDAELAHEVFRRAQRHLTLKPEWKVYFALWVTAIAGQSGVSVDDDVRSLLQVLAKGKPWWGRLANFGSGKLAFNELVSTASGIGQKTEAYFYEGARLLSAGDHDGAHKLFRRVLRTHMVNFYEFAMAQELLVSSP